MPPTMSRRTFLKGALALAALPALAGCQGVPRLNSGLLVPGPTRRLVIALPTDPAGLDPLLQTGLLEASVYCNIFDGLVCLDAEGQLQPALAESHRALDDHTWEFKLRQGVTFHNGEPFEASSVQATVQRMLDPASASPVRAQLKTIDRVETPDPQTAVLVTRQPFAPLLAELTGLMMLPPQALAKSGAKSFARSPVGTGAYRFVEWLQGDHLTLEANAAYWRGSPQIQRLEMHPMPDSVTRVLALLAGTVDMATNVSVHDLPTLAQHDLKLAQHPGVQALYVRLNTRKPPLDDVRVRRALALAVNVEQLITTVYGGHAHRLNGPYPPEVFGYDASAPPTPYDPAQARSLLREAGLAQGFSLNFSTPHGRYPGDDQVPEILAAFFADVGVHLNIQTSEWGAYLAQLQSGKGEHLFLLAGTNRTFDPHFTITRLYTSSGDFAAYYGNASVDALAAQAVATLDSEHRRAGYAQILTTLRQDVPAIWLAQLDDLHGLQPRLTWAPRADSLLWMHPARLG